MRIISSSPHIHNNESTKRIMIDVCIALLPTTIWGIYVFGLHALLVVVLSIMASVLTEYLLGKVCKENTIWDFSAVVTGLLVGLNMAPEVPLFIPCIASIFAIFVAKWSFGGLGANWANPAIAGRMFVFFSFSSSMNNFINPRTISVDVVSSATPLGIYKTAVNSGSFTGLNSLEIFNLENVQYSEIASKINTLTGWNVYNIDAFIGNISGCIGEVSTLCILIGAAYLFIRKVINISIPIAYFVSYSVLTWIFGGIPNGLGLFSGEVLSSLLRGSIFLAAFFMATDMVTTPITKKGMIIFGCGCGFFTFLFRFFGSLPEGASIAILFMNMLTPTIDKFCKPKKFGEVIKENTNAK